MRLKKNLINKHCSELTEAQEQEKLVKFLNELKKMGKILDFHAVPNENYLLSFFSSEKRYKILSSMSKKGLKAGVPDLYIYTTKKLVVIELKRSNKRKSKISDKQKYWNELLNELPYVEAFICYGADAAMKIILKELS